MVKAKAQSIDPLDALEDNAAPAAAPKTEKKIKAPKQDTLDLLDDAPKAKAKPKSKAPKAAKAEKGEARAKLAGETLVVTEKGKAVREGTVRHTVISAFKGGRKYDDIIENLVVKQPRGNTPKDKMAGFVAAKIASAVRKGFLAVK